MTDDELERELRETFESHATMITRGPSWPIFTPAATPEARRHWHWAAPLLAAAAVAALVIGLAVGFNGPDRPTPATPQPTVTADPVPAGMKAVDALGVEIYVPQDALIDQYCVARGIAVSRPLSLPAPSCPVESGAASVVVSIQTPAISAGGSAAPDDALPPACVTHVVLGSERSCVYERQDVSGPGSTSYSVSFYKHDVDISAGGGNRAGAEQALQIISSAHAAPIDRYGCTATDATPFVVSTPANQATRPRSSREPGRCWYPGPIASSQRARRSTLRRRASLAQ